MKVDEVRQVPDAFHTKPSTYMAIGKTRQERVALGSLVTVVRNFVSVAPSRTNCLALCTLAFRVQCFSAGRNSKCSKQLRLFFWFCGC